MKRQSSSLLIVTVFVNGAVGMMLELITSRIIAPYYGTAYVVWMNIIAVVLGGLSLGYWLGGKKSLKDPSFGYLCILVFMSGFLVALIALFKEVLLYVLSKYIPLVSFGSLLSVLVLFGPLNVLLGMITPYAVGLIKRKEANTGSLIGNIYAVGTVGSIAGIYILGYVLLPLMGHINILYGIAMALYALSFYVSTKKHTVLRILVTCITLLMFVLHAYSLKQKQSVLIDLDSQYNRIWIASYKRILAEGSYRARVLLNDGFCEQSAFNTDMRRPVEWDYFKIFRYSKTFQPNLSRALMIGGAWNAYSYFFLKDFPAAKMEIAEIDPRVTQIAKTYLGYSDNKQLSVLPEDGRMVVNRTTNAYDAIYVDAFSNIMPATHLNTREAYRAYSKALKPDGAVYINMISALEGNKSYLFRLLYATLQSEFPDVLAYGIDQNRPNTVQNIVLVGLKSKKLRSLSKKPFWQIKNNSGAVLTDDFMPADIIASGFLSYTAKSTDKYRRLLLPDAIIHLPIPE